MHKIMFLSVRKLSVSTYDTICGSEHSYITYFALPNTIYFFSFMKWSHFIYVKESVMYYIYIYICLRFQLLYINFSIQSNREKYSKLQSRGHFRLIRNVLEVHLIDSNCGVLYGRTISLYQK